MITNSVRSIVQAAAGGAEGLKLLRNNPEELGAKVGLTDREIAALRGADRLILRADADMTLDPVTITGTPPGSGSTINFETGSTITGRRPGAGNTMTFETGSTITGRRPGAGSTMSFETGSTITGTPPGSGTTINFETGSTITG